MSSGNGIGRELVRGLLDRGAKVAALDKNQAALDETAKLLGQHSNLATFALDISDLEAVKANANDVVAQWGAIDGLISNAGIIQPFVKIADLDIATMKRVINVNVWGVIYMTKTYLPLLMARPEAHICNVSSMGGFLPVPGQSVYGGSKAFVKLFTEGLHSEMAGTKVGVTTVFPGGVETHIAENSGVKVSAQMDSDKGKYTMTSAQDAAKIILDGIEDNKSRVLVGSDASFMDKIYRLSPERAAAYIAKQMASLLK